MRKYVEVFWRADPSAILEQKPEKKIKRKLMFKK